MRAFRTALSAVSVAGMLTAAPLVRADVSEALNYRNYSGAIEHHAPLFDSLNAATPIRENGQPYLGHTEWHITWDLQWRQDGAGRCTLQHVRTHLKATITLPQKSASDPRARHTFTPFLESLRQHELQHVAIARKAARAIDDRIWQLPIQRTCGELNQAANHIGQRLLVDARQVGSEYDRRTGHGRTEGAVLRD